MKIVFFGTSEFGAIVLRTIIRASIIPALVVTVPDKPAGRKLKVHPSWVKQVALEYRIPLLQPETPQEKVLSQLRSMEPDLFLVAAYGKILPQELLDIPKKGSLNVHPSLLPLYRGAAPVQAALLNGDEKTGATVILMDERMDHGPIVASSKIKIQNPKINYPELHNKLAKLGGELLIKTIPLWIAGKIKAVPQQDSKATYTKHLTKEAGRIDWTKSALYIERQVRALQPWPGTFCKIKAQSKKSKNTEQNLKILKAGIREGVHGEPGKTFLAQGKKLGVYAGKDALIIEELQLEGSKPVSSKEFLLGHKDILNNKLPI
ncbi:MAG: methionyl-tRNA formyltransferase [Parcubacteria group bacterium]|nr:methionyl-tRNA formyltransferase [Parcubacteria group bacterium]